MTEITDGITSVTPTLVVDTAHRYRSQNKIHPLMSGRVAATLGGTTPRSGTLGLLIKGEQAKQATVDLHREGHVIRLEITEQPTLSMTYVMGDGGISVEQLTKYDDLWMIAIEYQEVTE